MTRVFLDTNVFNKIVDLSPTTEALEAELDGQVECVTSILVLKELSLIPTVSRRQNVAACAIPLISGKIVKGWNQLIQEELRAYLRRQVTPSVFLDSVEQRRLVSFLERAADGEHYDQIQFDQVSRQAKEWKRQARDWQKRNYKKAKEYAAASGLNREELYGQNLEAFCTAFKTEWPTQLERLIPTDCRDAIDQVPDILAALDSLPHTHAFLRSVPALLFSEGLGRRPDKKGNDRADLRHVICAATSHIFISEESGLKGIFEGVYPGKRFMNLHEFINENRGTVLIS